MQQEKMAILLGKEMQMNDEIFPFIEVWPWWETEIE